MRCSVLPPEIVMHDASRISLEVQRITLNASSCMTISGGRTEQLDIIAVFLPCHWLYKWFSQFHSCGTYSVLSLSPSITGSSLQGLLPEDGHPPTFSCGVRWSCIFFPLYNCYSILICNTGFFRSIKAVLSVHPTVYTGPSRTHIGVAPIIFTSYQPLIFFLQIWNLFS